jgi:tetratricopeptide (TPR) repeat protein
LVARELRETPNWTMAVRLGKAARAEVDAVQDTSGVARASLQLAVPRGELGRRGLGDKGEPSPRKKSLELIGTELTAAVATFDAAGDRYFSALARNSLGSNYYYRGDFARALPMLEDAADRFRDAGEGSGTVMALGNFNVVVRSTGSYAEAAAAFDRLLGASLDVAAKQTLADILNNSAATQLAAGKYDKALLQFMQALATHDESKDQGGIARSMIGVADTYLHLGYATAARDYATRGRARALGGEDEIASLLIEGDAQRALGDNQSAAESHARAYELASNPDIESDALRARSALELVQDAVDVGNGAAARQWIADAAKYVKPERKLLELEFKLRQSHGKIAAGETQEAFAELMWRYDPLVRSRPSRIDRRVQG